MRRLRSSGRSAASVSAISTKTNLNRFFGLSSFFLGNRNRTVHLLRQQKGHINAKAAKQRTKRSFGFRHLHQDEPETIFRFGFVFLGNRNRTVHLLRQQKGHINAKVAKQRTKRSFGFRHLHQDAANAAK